MKKRYKNLFSLIITIALVFTASTYSFADVLLNDVATAQVSVGVNSTSATATFTWNKVTGTGVKYALRVWTGGATYEDYYSERIVNEIGLTKTSYVKDGLYKGTTYYYQVGVNSGYGYQYSGTSSFNTPNYEVVPLRTNPTASFKNSAKKYGEQSQSDNYIVVKWAKPTVSDYNKYVLYRNNTKVADVTNYSSYTDKDVPKGTYTYHIRAYFIGTDSYADFASNKITVKSHLRGTVKTYITWHAVMKKKTTFYKNSTGSSNYGSIPKNKEVSTTGNKIPSKMVKVYSVPTRIQVKYDGDTGWVKWSQIDIKYDVKRVDDYSISKKEDYINSKNLSSSTKYLIWVSRYTQRVNIFKGSKNNWTLFKVYDTNTGKFQRQTKGGIYKTKGHQAKVYRINQYGRAYYFVNSTSYGGSGTFHNIPRFVDNNSHNGSVIRRPNTGGCCRLHDSAASYIYHSIPLGTKVYLY